MLTSSSNHSSSLSPVQRIKLSSTTFCVGLMTVANWVIGSFSLIKYSCRQGAHCVDWEERYVGCPSLSPPYQIVILPSLSSAMMSRLPSRSISRTSSCLALATFCGLREISCPGKSRQIGNPSTSKIPRLFVYALRSLLWVWMIISAYQSLLISPSHAFWTWSARNIRSPRSVRQLLYCLSHWTLPLRYTMSWSGISSLLISQMRVVMIGDSLFFQEIVPAV